MLTGGTGFLGSHLLKQLSDKDYNVIVLKRSYSDIWRIKEFIDQIKFYDIDKTAIEDIFKENKIDYVVHLATY